MYNLKNSSVISRVVLNRTTRTRQRLIWTERNNSWRVFAYVPRDFCDIYGQCGANANRVINKNPLCQCLKGFEPKSPENWKLREWSEGCVRDNPLSCQDKDKNKDRDEDDFVKLVGLKLPDTRRIWISERMNLKECRAKCLSNCSCTTYSNRDNREGTDCRNWFGVLRDIRQIPESGQDLYIRIRASELGGNKKVSQKEEDLELPLFNLSAILAATGNFSENNKLGEGGFGPAYRGRLEDGQEIAVKRLSSGSGQGMDEFKNEVILIAKLQHRNLVKLTDNVQAKLLDWPKRFQIICGIARGLLYLHQDSRLRIIHRDLKASNVLLDNEMNPKISDFGMASTFGGDQTEGNTNRVVGTYGYMAPEYAFSGLFSTKSDVYSFCVVVLEIVSGKRSRFFHNENHGLTLIGHAWKLMKAARIFELIDVCLRESHNAGEVLRCAAHIGLLCAQQRPTDRPSMSSVILMLSSESELPQPEEPACYFMAVDSQEDDRFSCTTNNVTISELVPR
ncbi:G-type lectin S-receptor-like serine/threonine-protein kinase [Morus notabilis]|uniref:non-specific serine/threonine protein kinase n=1 Tax=Morus notabilis TaxID=981085 RepID=W9RTS6_9ROSA|nr:G-type lectin S-receptor-like serine/threonine-protein kinase [Morus notabilis]